jgi:RND family efflux transporter MFP subunit
MTIPGFLKKKRTYVILVIAILIALGFSSRGKKKPEDLYETDTVKKQNIVRTVEVTGQVKPAQRISLSFQQGGTLSSLVAKVGQTVKAGDTLAVLQDDDAMFNARKAQANLANAQASLNLRIAGETKQSIRISETDVEKAQAAYDKSLVDQANIKVTSANSVKTAQLALDTAQSDLNNTGKTKDQAIADAYTNLRAALTSALGPMQTGLTDGDKIIGVDDTVTNSTYKNQIGIHDSATLAQAGLDYSAAKAAKLTAETLVKALSNVSSQAEIDIAATTTRNALNKTQTYLTDVQKTLAASIAGNNLTEANFSSLKTQIDGDRTTVSGQNSALETAIQAVTNAKLGQTTSNDSLQNAYKTAQLKLQIAQSDAETQVKTADSNVTISKAALDAAKAALDLKKAAPRDVDLAPLRASVEAARIAYDQAVSDLDKIKIIAPVDGVVSQVDPSIGEQIAPNVPAVHMIGFADFDIEVLLPEADVAKVKIAQATTLTLDAFGDNRQFKGTVVSIEPDQTVVQDAVYYKARIEVEKDSAKDVDIKPGMTANVTILTAKADNVLTIPARAVKTDQTNATQTVRVLQNGNPTDRTVKTGLRADDGLVEVTEGLNEGETIIVADKS